MTVDAVRKEILLSKHASIPVNQAFGGGDGTSSGLPSRGEDCTRFMTSRCNAAFQNEPLMMKHSASIANQSVAAFLIIRPPIAFLGFGWESVCPNCATHVL